MCMHHSFAKKKKDKIIGCFLYAVAVLLIKLYYNDIEVHFFNTLYLPRADYTRAYYETKQMGSSLRRM